MDQKILDYYASFGPLTDPGPYTEQIASLPNDVETLVKIVQQLGIYDIFAFDIYGVTLSDERKADIHVRSIEEMLGRLFSINSAPLEIDRPPNQRIGCRCHAYTKLLVTFLRTKGVPARARCGFATYFKEDHFEDHWVCEYWHTDDARWVIVDPQLDKAWRTKLKIDWDPLDLSPDHFLTAGEAWEICRLGEVDPNQFGISFYDGMVGTWLMGGSLTKDVAALNKMEMLPWDLWRGTPKPHVTLTQDELSFYDSLAALTNQCDQTFDELRSIYQSDSRLLVPDIIFNFIREVDESVRSI